MTGTPPAIVSSPVGKGNTILADVHLEMSERECRDALCSHTDMASHVHMSHRLAETGTRAWRSSAASRPRRPRAALNVQGDQYQTAALEMKISHITCGLPGSSAS